MHSDIVNSSWLQTLLPEKMYPYAILSRWDRPVGVWLLFLPCLWGFALRPNIEMGIEPFLFFLGAILMRGAGCTYNDMVDCAFDRQVKRTASRPLAASILRHHQAMGWLVIQLGISFIILLMLPSGVLYIGAASLVLVAIYPWMKRFTYWPQAFLGLTFNWGVLMGGLCAQSRMSWQIICLYGAGFFWTMGYDTIYAHQDKEDDLLIGVKSTALKFSSYPWVFIGMMYALTLCCLIILGVFAHFSYYFFLVLLGVTVICVWQGVKTDLANPLSCLKAFKINVWIGAAIGLAILVGRVL